MTGSWVGAGFYLDDDFRLYLRRMRKPGHAVAGSRWYRTLLTRELIRAGEFASTSVDIPMRRVSASGGAEARWRRHPEGRRRVILLAVPIPLHLAAVVAAHVHLLLNLVRG